VAGEAKRGKSTLVNSLLVRAVLPAGVTPLTSVATTVRYGQDEIVTAVFADGHTEALPLRALEDLASEFPSDARLLALIGLLAVESAEFAAMWAANTIRPSQSAVYRMQHPVVGRLTITQQLLTTAQAPGQTLVICSAPRHSPSSEALTLLARTVRK
jgi:hypothetical protein